MISGFFEDYDEQGMEWAEELWRILFMCITPSKEKFERHRKIFPNFHDKTAVAKLIAKPPKVIDVRQWMLDNGTDVEKDTVFVKVW